MKLGSTLLKIRKLVMGIFDDSDYAQPAPPVDRVLPYGAVNFLEQATVAGLRSGYSGDKAVDNAIQALDALNTYHELCVSKKLKAEKESDG